MKVFKKNQLIILIIALILVTAGYLSYTTSYENTIPTSTNEVENNIDLAAVGDARLVSSNNLEENNINANIINTNTNIVENVTENTVQTNSNNTDSTYYTNSRIDRDKMYSQMLETYEKILGNENISSEQKSIATQEIKNINQLKNSIMIAENLIKTKGFEDCIIFVNGNSISIIVKKEELQTEDIAQIQNIISRELSSELNNIHISNKP